MKIYPHFWFNGRAEEAMEFYMSVFDSVPYWSPSMRSVR